MVLIIVSVALSFWLSASSSALNAESFAFAASRLFGIVSYALDAFFAAVVALSSAVSSDFASAIALAMPGVPAVAWSCALKRAASIAACLNSASYAMSWVRIARKPSTLFIISRSLPRSADAARSSPRIFTILLAAGRPGSMLNAWARPMSDLLAADLTRLSRIALAFFPFSPTASRLLRRPFTNLLAFSNEVIFPYLSLATAAFFAPS